MSKFVKCKTEFKDDAMFLESLMEAGGWRKDQIEIHAEPVPLYGYRNDVRPEKAHVVIRRGNVGPASNDIGFEKTKDGSYVAYISEYDQGQHGKPWMSKLKEAYGFRVIHRQQTKLGRRVSRQKNAVGRTMIVVEGFR